MSQVVEAPVGVGLMVPVEELAPHPENVRTELRDIDELARSIVEQGVLQPLVVVSLDRFLLENPELAQRVEIGNWVVIAGHRRLAAAMRADVGEVPVVVREDLASSEAATAAMIAENVPRAALTPMEEAKAFGRLREKNWSERKIAQAAGVSNGQVHKRLSLLRLPAPVVAKFEAGELTIAEALKLVELPDDQILSVWREGTDKPWLGIAGAVDRRRKRLALDRKLEETRALIARHGVEVVEDIHAILGDDAGFHRLPWSTKVEAVNPVDTMATVGLSHGDEVEVTFYSRTGHLAFDVEEEDDDGQDGQEDAGEPRAGASGGSTVGAAGAEEAQAAQRGRDARQEGLRAAAGKRREACGRLVAAELPAELMLEVIADAVLVDVFIDSFETVAFAADWCGREPDPESKSNAWADQWMGDQGNAGGEASVRAALALALADLEQSLRPPTNSPWSPRGARHVRRLVEHGEHKLSAIEEAELAASDAARNETEEDDDA